MTDLMEQGPEAPKTPLSMASTKLYRALNAKFDGLALSKGLIVNGNPQQGVLEYKVMADDPKTLAAMEYFEHEVAGLLDEANIDTERYQVVYGGEGQTLTVTIRERDMTDEPK